jgi:hypothetical protein
MGGVIRRLQRVLGERLGLLVDLVALHSVAVFLALTRAPRWAAACGGWGEASPLFFARQAGAIYLVVAAGYAGEWCLYRGVRLLLATKTVGASFLGACWLGGERAWVVPLPAVADGMMGVAVALAHRGAPAATGTDTAPDCW